jgi:phosphoenolpyruvate-protein kinase (PTS system EI component)
LALRYVVAPEHVARETARLEAARAASRRQLEQIRARVAERAGSDLAHLFEAQLLMLDDAFLLKRANEIIVSEHVNAEWAVQRAFGEISAIFRDIDDAYLRERQGDVADVVGRLCRNLRPARDSAGDLMLEIDQPSVLVADEIAPSLVGQLDRERVLGLAIDTGSRTHHAAILARSMGLPTVAGLGSAALAIRPGAIILVDGDTGELVIDPSDELIAEVQARGHATHGVVQTAPPAPRRWPRAARPAPPAAPTAAPAPRPRPSTAAATSAHPAPAA